MAEIRVRFAPSPTGNLHIGGARTALFNWLFARKNKGVFVLRVEDTDLERNLKVAEDGIMNGLRWLGLEWDEGPDKGGVFGPYRQSERIDIYNGEAHRLLQKGIAYQCYCTPEDLARQREEARKKGLAARYDGRCRNLDDKARREFEALGIKPVLRLKALQEGQTTVHDLIKGDVSFENKTMDDFIIMKSNGLPAYNFACVVDDSLMRISHVIRAEEHLSNTPKQIIIYQALGYQSPLFAHVPMILAPDRSKLSKRHGATALEEFRSDGFFSDALVNYLALLGWSPGDEREMMTAQEIVSSFSLDAVSGHAAIYDIKKLTWLNARYLNAFELDKVVQDAIPFLEASNFLKTSIDDKNYAYISKVVDTVRSRVHTLAELSEASSYFFVDGFSYDEKGVRKFFTKPGISSLLSRGKEKLDKVYPFELQEVESAYRDLIDELKISGSALIHPTRLALSGKTMGPGLFDIMVTLGKEKCLQRLQRAMDWINDNINPGNIN